MKKEQTIEVKGIVINTAKIIIVNIFKSKPLAHFYRHPECSVVCKLIVLAIPTPND